MLLLSSFHPIVVGPPANDNGPPAPPAPRPASSSGAPRAANDSARA